MNCHEALALLQRRLDGERIAPTEDLELHLESCASCRPRFAAVPVLLEGLKGIARPPVPPLFSSDMLGRILEDRRQRQQRMRRRLWSTAVLAASILVMALAGYFWLPHNRPVVGPGPLVHKKGPNDQVIPEPVDGPSLRQSVQEAGSAVASLSGRLADQTLEQARLLWTAAAPPLEVPPMAWPRLDQLEEPLEPAAQSLLQTGQGVSEGLQTVTQTTRRAVDFFMRELAALDTREPNR